MAVRSDVLLSARITGGSSDVQSVVVPSGETWIVKNVTAWNVVSGSNRRTYVSLQRPASDEVGIMMIIVPGSDTITLETWVVADPDSEIILSVGGSSSCDMRYVVSGAKLIGSA